MLAKSGAGDFQTEWVWPVGGRHLSLSGGSPVTNVPMDRRVYAIHGTVNNTSYHRLVLPTPTAEIAGHMVAINIAQGGTFGGTLKEGSIEFEMIWDTNDAGFTAIKDAFFGNTAIGLAVMDQDIADSGSQGLQADCSITSFSRSEALEEAITVSVTAKPTYSTTAPAWVTVP